MADNIAIAARGSTGQLSTPRAAMSLGNDNNIITIAPGDWDDGVGLNYIAPGVHVTGNASHGTYRTLLYNRDQALSAQGNAWQSGPGVTFEHIALESRVSLTGQSQVFGTQHNYTGGPQVPDIPFTNTLNDVYMYGHSYTLYYWAEGTPTCKATDCYFQAGTIAVVGGQGSGPAAQFFNLWNCDVVCDYDRYQGAGVGSDTVGGVVMRGGVLNMYGGSITIKGSSRMDYAVGAWTSLYPDVEHPEYLWPVINLYDVRCRVDPNGAPVAYYDAFAETGKINIFGGSGSNALGAWRVQGAGVSVYP